MGCTRGHGSAPPTAAWPRAYAGGGSWLRISAFREVRTLQTGSLLLLRAATFAHTPRGMPSRPALPHAVALYACDAAEKTVRPQRGTSVKASGAASSPRAPPRPRAETGFTLSRIVQLEARADPEPGSASLPTTRLGEHKGESYGLLSDPTLGGPSRSREMPAELVFFSWWDSP